VGRRFLRIRKLVDAERCEACDGRPARALPILPVTRVALHVVLKRQLLECVWGDVCVEAGILTVHVAALRKLLGDSRGQARFIETVSGYGYRFIADVRCAEGSADCALSVAPEPTSCAR
jgi:DNA-binding winged helix-turn-helix (wHTH) protein